VAALTTYINGITSGRIVLVGVMGDGYGVMDSAAWTAL